MKTHILAALTLATALTACNATSTPVQPIPSSGLPLQGAADAKSVLLGNQSYTLTEARSYPLIDSWTYNIPGETKQQWTKRIELQRYKKVNAAEIFNQMHDAVRGRMEITDAATRTVCFITEEKGGQLKEVNIWKYADIKTADGKTLTYANGILWHFPAGMAFNTFMKGEFPRTCKAIGTMQLVTPPPLS